MPNLDFLRLEDLEKSQKLTRESPKKAIQDALAKLHPHLDDPFLELDCADTGMTFGPKFLRVFPAVEDPAIELYLLVNHEGHLRLGRVDDLKVAKDQKLVGFDEEQHQILSVNVSNTHFDGDGVDVWIVVRMMDAGEASNDVYYRGIAGCESGQLFLEPAPQRGNQQAEWTAKPLRPGDANWLLRWDFECAYDQHPFQCLDEKTFAWLKAVDEASNRTLEKVRLNDHGVCCIYSDTVKFFSPTGELQQDFSFPAKVESVAFWHQDGLLCCIAGCSDRHLVLACEGEREKKFKACDEVPCGLEMVWGDGDSLPDLLVSFLDGRLIRLQQFKPDKLKQTYDHLWRVIGASELSRRLTLAEKVVGDKNLEKPWRKAVFGSLVRNLMERDLGQDWFCQLDHSQVEDLADSLKDLFTEPEEDFSVLNEGLRHLKRALTEVIKRTTIQGEVQDTWNEFLEKLSLEIYEHATLDIQHAFDQLFRTFDQKYEIPEKTFKKLFKYSEQNSFFIKERGAKVNRSGDDIYQSILKVEGWSDAYWEEDYLRLAFFRTTSLVDVTTLSNNGQNFALFAGSRILVLFPLEKKMYQLERSKEDRKLFQPTFIGNGIEIREGPWQEDILCLANLPGDPAKLLVGTASGKIFLCQLENQKLKQLGVTDLKQFGSPRCLVTCVVGSRHKIAAVINNSHHAHLVHFWLEGSQFSNPSHEKLTSPRIHLVEMANKTKDYFHILKAGKSRITSRFCEIDEKNSFKRKAYGHEIQSGARTLCFEKQNDPHYGLAGERNGNLWCHKLPHQPSSLVDYCWSHHFKSSICTSIALEYEGEPHFLIGTENGDLTLLRARDGKRIWKHRFRRSIEKLLAMDAEAKRILIVMKGGWVALFRQIPDRDAHFQALKSDLAAYRAAGKTYDDLKWRNADNAVRAIYGIKSGALSLEALFRTNKDRSTRARVLRYAVWEKIGINQTTMQELNFRDLALYLAYLADGDKTNQDMAWTAIKAKIAEGDAEERGDHSQAARMAAVATYLQRFSSRKPSLEDLFELAIPAQVLAPANWKPHTNWVGMIFVRLVLEALQREKPNLNPKHKENFFWLLPQVLHFSPNLLQEFEDALPHNSELQLQMKAFRSLAEGSINNQELPFPNIQALWEPFRLFIGSFWPLEHPGRLFTVLTQFFMFDFEAPWHEERLGIMERLRELHQTLLAMKRLPQPFEYQILGILSVLFPDKPIPADVEPLTEQVAWYQNWQQKLLLGPEVKVDESDPWLDVWSGIQKQTRHILRTILEAESTYLAQQVRPRLHLDRVQFGAAGRVILKLSTAPDGLGEGEDVSIVYDCEGAGGLLGLEGLSQHREDHERYPGPFAHRVFELTGLLTQGQKQVTVRAAYNSDKGSSQTHWTFDLPAQRQAGSLANLVDDLPSACAFLCQELDQQPGNVVILVCDQALGQEDLVRYFLKNRHATRIDIDTLLAPYGKGRIYSQEALSSELILNLIEQERAKHSKSQRSRPLIFAPMDQTMLRLGQGRHINVIKEVLQKLEQRHKKGGGNAWWLVIGSESGHQLLKMGTPGLPLLWVHASLQKLLYRGDTSSERATKELLTLVQNTLPKHKEDVLNTCLRRLGWDVRLIFGWLSWFKARSEKMDISHTVEKYLDEAQGLLRADLATLPGEELIVAMLGARAISKVPLDQLYPDMVAAEDLETTTCKRSAVAKSILKTGAPLDRQSLTTLRSDIGKRGNIRLQGLGRGSLLEPQTSFYQIFQVFQRDTKTHLFRELSRRGIGRVIHGHFRTHSPYRFLINHLYAKFRHEPAESWDGLVYRDLSRGEQTPLESLSLENIKGIGKASLEKLLPGAACSDRASAVVKIAHLWLQEEPNQEACRLALQGFFPGLKLGAPDKDPLQKPLASVKDLVFCLDDNDPCSGFLFWLNARTAIQKPMFYELAEALERAWRKKLKDQGVGEAGTWSPLLILAGPGAENQPHDPKRLLSFLGKHHFLRAAWAVDYRAEILRQARRQHSLLHRSPFQTVTALPPNSPVFFGREQELAFIKSRVREGSILIVGSRRVGKTSLLNKVWSWTKNQPDLAPIYVDLQGDKNRQAFFNKLRLALAESDWKGFPHQDLNTLVDMIREKGRLPVFLLNEIDDLTKHDENFVFSWRTLNDAKKARFVMVGYNTLRLLGGPESPFYHFTQGTAYENKAIPLSQLSHESARQIPDQLETSNLALRWQDQKQKELAYRLLLDRSYRIPWVLQSYCQKIVELANERRIDTLTHKLVAELVQEEGSNPLVWQHIENLDYAKFQEDGAKDLAFPYAMKILLYALVRERYLLEGLNAPIRDKKLPARSHHHPPFGFTPVEAKWAVEKAIGKFFLNNEKARVLAYFKAMDIKRALSLMTLTLLVEPSAEDSEHFGFLLHILPIELYRKYGKSDPTLDNEILKLAINLVSELP